MTVQEIQKTAKFYKELLEDGILEEDEYKEKMQNLKKKLPKAIAEEFSD